LPVPTGTLYSKVYGGDPTGRYLVGEGTYYGGSEGLLWVGGQLTPVNQSSLSPYIQVQFNAVNSHGVIVGERLTSDSSFHTDAFIYRHGRFTLLPAPILGEATNAMAINSRGDVVGTADGATGFVPVEWPADHPGTVRLLSTPSGAGGFANGIDEDGTVVGYLTPYPDGTPYVWPTHGRGAHALPVPVGSTGGNAEAISNGWVAGDVMDTATGSSALAEWNLRTGAFKMWPDIGGYALSVNRSGTLGVAGGEIVHADGRVVPVTGWVYTISAQGVAAGTNNDYIGHAELWLGC
jgi:hypothetical protein